MLMAVATIAEEATINGQYYVVDIELQTVEEFSQLLERAEQLLLAGTVVQDDVAEVTFVLHGPVLRNLLRQNYLDNKRTVDLAASLSAMGSGRSTPASVNSGNHNTTVSHAPHRPSTENTAIWRPKAD